MTERHVTLKGKIEELGQLKRDGNDLWWVTGAIVREGFKEDHPEIAAFLTNMYIPLDELQAAMAKAQATSYEEAIDAYIAENQERIQGWIDG